MGNFLNQKKADALGLNLAALKEAFATISTAICMLRQDDPAGLKKFLNGLRDTPILEELRGAFLICVFQEAWDAIKRGKIVEEVLCAVYMGRVEPPFDFLQNIYLEFLAGYPRQLAYSVSVRQRAAVVLKTFCRGWIHSNLSASSTAIANLQDRLPSEEEVMQTAIRELLHALETEPQRL